MQSVSKAAIQITRASELFVGLRIMQLSGQLFNVRRSLRVFALQRCPLRRQAC